jgi:outer membrane biosynthesis protein TonB
MTKISFIVALLLIFGLPLTTGLQAKDSDTRPLQLISSTETVIPANLQSLAIEYPYVKFQVTVNEKGTVVDYLALEAPHFGLLAKAEELVQKAKFLPAFAKGKAVGASAEIYVSFYDPVQRAYFAGSGVLPYGSSTIDASERRFYEISRDHFVYRCAKPVELDHPVELREGKIMVMTDPAGRPAAGQCVIEYYIDSHGDVRTPRIVKTDNDVVAMSALLTVQHLRYAPPTQHGAPTYVRVCLPMSFGPSTTVKPAAE